jgi:glucose-specific phosphotransferase system IIA component
VPDEVFAQRIAGDGLAVLPESEEVVAPAAGRVAKLFPGGHGIVVETAGGVQVLVHLGIDTVHRHGRGFTTHVEEGDDVQAGDRLVTLDLAQLVTEGVDMVSPVIAISGQFVRPIASGQVTAGEPLFDAADR